MTARSAGEEGAPLRAISTRAQITAKGTQVTGGELVAYADERGRGAVGPAATGRRRPVSRLPKASVLPPCTTVYYMETTAREFNQNASKILAAAEHGESITVTKNGRPVAILSPVREADMPVSAYPTDPMGEDDEAPVFHSESPVDWSAGRGDYLKGFGA